MTSRPAVSLIIVSYCTRDLLRECLQSVGRVPDSEVEVIVVDNHSTDGSLAMLQAEFPHVRVLENSENLGFAKANNQGIRHARGHYVVLLNSDTVVPPGALPAMTAFMEANPEAGAAACRLVYPDGRIQASVSRRTGPGIARLMFRLSGLSHLVRGNRMRCWVRQYAGFVLGSTLRSYLDPYLPSQAPLEVETISGTCLLVRRLAIDEVGLLDPNFFMYLEDLDYCIRLRKAGWKLFYLPQPEIIHLVGKSSGGRMRQHSWRAYQSLFYFYGKHYSNWAGWLARLLVLLSFCGRWLWTLVRAGLSSDPIHSQNRRDIQKIIGLCVGGSGSETLARAARTGDQISNPVGDERGWGRQLR